MPHAAPSRVAPTATSDLEAGPVLKLGEFTNETTLNLSEARIVLLKTLQTREKNNKQMESTEVTEKLRLTQLKERTWYVVPSCATTGEGLLEGLVSSTINKHMQLY